MLLSLRQLLPTILKRLCILAPLVTTALSSEAIADEPVIVIEEARVNAASSGNNTEAYMQIINYSEQGYIRLLSASSTLSNDVRLTKADTLLIEAGQAVQLSPDSYNINLQGISKHLVSGESIILRLRFAYVTGETSNENISEYDIETTVVKPGTHLHEDESGHAVVHINHD